MSTPDPLSFIVGIVVGIMMGAIFILSQCEIVSDEEPRS